MAAMDEVSAEAQRAGAVNTVVNDDGRLFGQNTDGAGLVRALREEAGFSFEGSRVLIIGAGGAARGVVMALAGERVEDITIANRTPDRAAALVESVRHMIPSAEAGPLDADGLRTAASRSRLIVNCTSLGMSGGAGQGETPMTANAIPPHTLVCDLVYNPSVTPLLREAEEAGAKTLGGLPMLVYQGAAAFEIWTGQDAPVRVMFKAAEEALRARQTMEL